MSFKSLVLATGLSLAMVSGAPAASWADCFGSGAFQTCNDAAGNSYTVNRFGNTTIMNGYNSRTGSSWSQNSTSLGNTTFHNGVTNGRSWNMTDQSFGSMRLLQGTDSRGNSFSTTCGPLGCF